MPRILKTLIYLLLVSFALCEVWEQTIENTSGSDGVSFKLTYDTDSTDLTVESSFVTDRANWSQHDDTGAICALTDDTYTIPSGTTVTAIIPEFRCDTSIGCDSSTSVSLWRNRLINGTVTESGGVYSYAEVSGGYTLNNQGTGSTTVVGSGFNMTNSYTYNGGSLAAIAELPSHLLCWFVYTDGNTVVSSTADLTSDFGSPVQIAAGGAPVVETNTNTGSNSTGEEESSSYPFAFGLVATSSALTFML
jgi:hypothetical protein